MRRVSFAAGVSVLALSLLGSCGGEEQSPRPPVPVGHDRSKTPVVADDVLHGPFADADRSQPEHPGTTVEDGGSFSEAEEKVVLNYASALKEMHANQLALLRATERKLAAAKRGDRAAAAREVDAVDEVWLALNQAADRVTLYGAKLNALVSGDTSRNERITERVRQIAGIYPSDSPALIKKQAEQAQENLKEALRLLK